MDTGAVITGQGNMATDLTTNTTTTIGITMGIGTVGITTAIRGNRQSGVFAPGWQGGCAAAVTLHFAGKWQVL